MISNLEICFEDLPLMIADVADMGHRPNQAEVLGQGSEPGVKLADVHPRNGRGDRLVWPSNFLGSVWLHVPGVEMTRSTAKQDEDAGLLGRASPKSLVGIDACRNRTRQTHRQGTDPPHLEQSPTGDRGRRSSLVAER